MSITSHAASTDARRGSKTHITSHLPFWLDHAVGRRLIEASKHHSLWGFDGIPIYDLIRDYRSEVKQDELLVRAGALTFNFMMALFPSIIVLFTIIPFIPIRHFDRTLLQTIQQLLPANAYMLVADTINDIIMRPHGSLLSLGFVLSLYFASNGIMSMQRAFDKSGRSLYFTRRTPLQKRIVSLLLVFVLAVILLIALAMIVGGAIALNALSRMDYVSYSAFFVLAAFRWTVLVALFLMITSVVFRYVPSMQRRVPFFSTGAVISTVMSILTSIGFSYYVNNFSTYNKVYGAVGAFIVLMIWFNINASVLLIGFEINVTLSQLKHRREKLRSLEL